MEYTWQHLRKLLISQKCELQDSPYLFALLLTCAGAGTEEEIKSHPHLCYSAWAWLEACWSYQGCYGHCDPKKYCGKYCIYVLSNPVQSYLKKKKIKKSSVTVRWVTLLSKYHTCSGSSNKEREKGFGKMELEGIVLSNYYFYF